MRKTSLTASLIAIGGALLSGSGLLAAAVPAAGKTDVPAEIKKTLEARYPQVEVVDVKPAPIAGLYEVFTGDAIIYTTADGAYLIGGPLIDTASKSNLTAARIDERNAIDFSTLPLNLAIKTVKGNGHHKLAVFADPDCPYCKELEHSLATFDDVTVYTFLYPLTSLHPDAIAKAHTIWCSADRSQAWTQWMVDGKPAPGSSSCKEDPTDELLQLGKKLRINSTPMLFFADGQRAAGALKTAQLRKRFDAIDAAAAQPASKGSSSQKAAGSTN